MKLNAVGLPDKVGLYDPSYEKDSCGVGFIVSIDGIATHDVLLQSKTMLTRMEHRGACACDNDTGDGAGVLTSIPHKLFKNELKKQNIDLPEPGKYAVAMIFMDKGTHLESQSSFERIASKNKLKVFHWRTVPVNSNAIGTVGRSREPLIRQAFLIDDENNENCSLDFNKRCYLVRKQATHFMRQKGLRFYFCSLSTKTIVYKALVTPAQLWNYYLDFLSEDYECYLSLIHSRFSTNTFPSWERAHPYRCLAHNGEINTLRGNINYMHAREGVMKNSEFGDELKKVYPVIEQDQSDSGCFDNVIEFLVNCGNRSLPEAMITLVPEAWEHDENMNELKKTYYKCNSFSMEPWDGPALLSFTDGRYIGAILDRNGLRPSRYYLLKSNHLVMASEVGVINVDPSEVLMKGRLKPGRMLLVDTLNKEFTSDEKIKNQLCLLRPVSEWVKRVMTIDDLRKAYESSTEKTPINYPKFDDITDDRRLPLFGYNVEILNMLLLPMIKDSKESLGSMGNDAPLACLSDFSPVVYDYFKQLFAQVTNPPIDPIREKIVMSLSCPIGPENNLLEPNEYQCDRLFLEQPVLSLNDMEVIRNANYKNLRAKIIDITVPVSDCKPGEDFLLNVLNRICDDCEKAVQENYSFLILSDRNAGENRLPVSAILAVGCVHHYLIDKLHRMKVALIVETGEAREIHHLCVLLGYGADAICPYLVFETIINLNAKNMLNTNYTNEQIFYNYTYACKAGIAKVMAKMGISTLHSYKGAQIFEAVGIDSEVVNKCFRGTPSRIGGVNFKLLSKDIQTRYRLSYGTKENCDDRLAINPGIYHWRSSGEKHINDPDAIASLQDATKTNSRATFKKFTQHHTEATKECTIRGQFELAYGEDNSISIDLVESAAEIVKRFATGAMSFGSISIETHTTLAKAMNRIGGKSNTGEGGENLERLLDDENKQESTKSAIKQVASGRFGVSSVYLAHATDLQIKMAQGAKPGEGGELPGTKVSEDIAKCRNSVPGVGLISPPPHHDIYSIEDLAELIYDLKCANPNARISVKLVSEVGVGVVAAGVAKAKAEHITISGHDGGTGASSWTGIKHAGLPWELGISETHQTLVLNDLRSRVILQADGQIRTAQDVVIAALLGADEFGFATAPLITLGCIMMRKCHLNTCPVGIATQDPVLREKFKGKPEYIINYFFLLAEDIREMMAKLGFRSFTEMIGRTDKLKVREDNSDKRRSLNYDLVLTNATRMRPEVSVLGGSVKQIFNLEKRLDQKVIEQAKSVLNGTTDKVTINMDITNEDRAFGSTISYHISIKYKDQGLKDDSIKINLKGHAGQSFGAFLARGVTLELCGDANDYVGKGLSGGTIIIYPPPTSPFKSEDAIIVGNVVLYGAITGKCFIRGQAAERFCVRNSGVTAISEGCGDHGCEYMTGGVAIILGSTGRNFAAGMSGGIAYVYDPKGEFPLKCNKESVALDKLELEEDLNSVKQLLNEFIEKTKSIVATSIVQNWETTAKQFVKVFPHEYRKVLESLKKKQQEQKPVVASAPKPDNTVVDIEDSVKNPEKLRGFFKYSRNTEQYRPVESRIKDWDEIHNHVEVRKKLKTQAARCMDCGVPFCQSKDGCPLGNIIPKWNDLIFQDNWKEALEQLLQTNNFPEFTGRVCPAPCEGSCVLGIIGKPVTIKNIECAIIDHAFQSGWIKPLIPKTRTGKRIVVVGSGPSGLAAAAQLNKAGHSVTVYERNDVIGGLLRYGIPTMKLSKEVVQRRVDLMAQEGVEFHTNVEIGKTITADKLLDNFDVVLMTTGATWPRDLKIPGRELNGIYFAMNFLQSWQQHQGNKTPNVNDLRLLAKDKKVLVIGGGDTGVDCIGTALRQGAKDIVTFEILPRPPDARGNDNPWPTWPRVFKLDYGHEESLLLLGKDPRIFLISTKEFINDGNGNVCGVKTVLIEWKKDDQGRWLTVEVPGSEKVYECDLVLLAMGFMGPEEACIEQLKLKKDPRLNIETPNGKYNTSVPRVYAAGDCRRGQSLVVWAIHEGRQAARQIDYDLMGTTSLAGPAGVIVPQ